LCESAFVEFTRSTKCSFKLATEHKHAEVQRVLDEYAVVVNFFIDRFWARSPRKAELLAPIVNLPVTWLDYTLRQTAAREAIDMISAAKKRWGPRAVKPVHKAKSMRVSTGTACVAVSATSTICDMWLTIKVGAADRSRRTVLQIPLRSHKHMRRLQRRGGKLCGSFVIAANSVQLAYRFADVELKQGNKALGVDTGINVLASLSTGEQYGREVKAMIARIRQCKQGSNGQRRARRAIKQFFDTIAKRIASKDVDIIVAEDLTGISHGTRARLGKNMRATIGNWNQRYWLSRLEMAAEANRVRFVSVEPAYTSQTCHQCGYVSRSNRHGESFRCVECNHTANADINAARNILARFEGGAKAPHAKR